MNTRTLLMILSTLALLLTGCGDNGLERLQQQGELVVLTRNAPTTLFEARDGLAGMEHDLVTRFADDHGLELVFKELGSVDEIITAIQNNQGHIAAAGLTHTHGRREEGFIFGPEYQQVQQQVVCRRNNGKIPGDPADLVGLDIAIIKNSSYQETLSTLKTSHPELEWKTINDLETEQLLEQVWNKKIHCTLADSTIVSINQRYYPELVVAFDIGEPQWMSWVLAPEWQSLKPDLDNWFDKIREDGFLDTLLERYYGHVEIFDYVDMRSFTRRIKQRLPLYRDAFEKAAMKHDIPWTLLAAQAYQESHWRKHAKSPTGVRGIMMLTLTTAKSVGVKNRLDPIESIQGGAKYLRKMIDRIPEEVTGENRLWLALAAYNVGYGHLSDARELALRLDKNPNLWVDLKEVLPLLSQKKYYKTLKHGYARGTEPVRYVTRIRNYRQVLEKQLNKQ